MINFIFDTSYTDIKCGCKYSNPLFALHFLVGRYAMHTNYLPCSTRKAKGEKCFLLHYLFHLIFTIILTSQVTKVSKIEVVFYFLGTPTFVQGVSKLISDHIFPPLHSNQAPPPHSFSNLKQQWRPKLFNFTMAKICLASH